MSLFRFVKHGKPQTAPGMEQPTLRVKKICFGFFVFADVDLWSAIAVTANRQD